ncbi:MAG: hypothetical protein U1F43_31045 [Myxococcota bacterium]
MHVGVPLAVACALAGASLDACATIERVTQVDTVEEGTTWVAALVPAEPLASAPTHDEVTVFPRVGALRTFHAAQVVRLDLAIVVAVDGREVARFEAAATDRVRAVDRRVVRGEVSP